MKIFKNFLFHDEFEDGTTGEGGQSGGDVTQTQDDNGNGEGAGGQSPPAFDQGAAMAAFADTLAQSMKKAGLGAAPQPQAKEMSDEEFRKLTKYYSVASKTPDGRMDYSKLTGLFGNAPEGTDPNEYFGPRAALLQEMLDGSSTHTMHVVKAMLDTVLAERFAPYQALLVAEQKRAADEFVKQIADASPALKGKENLVTAAIDALKRAGYQSSGNAAQDRHAIMQMAEQMGKMFDPNFSVANQRNGAPGGGGRGNMPGSITTGGGSAGGGAARKNEIASIFEK